MLQKAITFNDLDGKPVTEIFYFNLNKAEVAELELSKRGGMSSWIKNLAAAENGAEIMGTFKKIILSSVGRRSDDGRRFIKSQEIRDDFEQTEAYSELFMELVTNAKAGADFVMGLLPKDLADAVAADGNVAAELQLPGAADETKEDGDNLPAWVKENRAPRQNELVGLSQAELLQAFQWREHLAGQSQ